MLKFMILFYCKIIHVLPESQLTFITGYHQINQKNIVNEQIEQKNQKQ